MNEDNSFVFVVDDDRSVRESLRNLIRSAGLNVQTFASAEEFLSSRRPDAPGCLVLDVQLPALSGLDLQQVLAKDLAQIPIIFITGHKDIPMTVQAMKAGAVDFLLKPFSADALLNCVRLALASHGEEKALTLMKARVAERERIARDLHDTLLQSFQGVLLKFSAISYLIPNRPAEAQKTLESVVEQAREAITEGRDVVQGLRSSTIVNNDPARAISILGEELAADQAGGNCPDFQVQVEGTSWELAPLVREEVYRIAGEALRNAFRHARARRIEVEIHYDNRQFRLRVRDNGKGMDPKVLAEGGRAGHYGMAGMQERAKLVEGKLAVWSELDSGTEAELTIPASVACSKSAVACRSSGKGTHHQGGKTRPPSWSKTTGHLFHNRI
jgi:signal transduction histidine kinase